MGCSFTKFCKVPDFSYPERFQYAHKGKEVESNWWTIFKDNKLNTLINAAIKNNHDIRIATERVIQLYWEYIKSRSTLFPRLDFSSGFSRTRNAYEVMGKTQVNRINNYSFNFLTSYEIDLYKKLSDMAAASKEQYLAAIQNANVIKHTVIAQVISSYIQQKYLMYQLKTLEKIKNIKKRKVSIVKSRYESGLLSYIEVKRENQEYENIKVQITNLSTQIKTLQQKINVLCGKYPYTESNKDIYIDYYKSLPPIPSNLPSEILKNRPDIQMAEKSLKSAYLMAKVAYKNRFPSIKLTGNLGYASNKLTNLLSPENKLWQIAFNLTEPIFDADKLKAEEKKAISKYRETFIEYSQTVLNAFFEIENLLMQYEELSKELSYQKQILKEREDSYKTIKARYEKGLVSLYDYLNAKESLLLEKNSILSTKLMLIVNRINLYKAFGGKWI